MFELGQNHLDSRSGDLVRAWSTESSGFGEREVICRDNAITRAAGRLDALTSSIRTALGPDPPRLQED